VLGAFFFGHAGSLRLVEIPVDFKLHHYGGISPLVVGEKVRRERRWTSAGAIPARKLVRSTR